MSPTIGNRVKSLIPREYVYVLRCRMYCDSSKGGSFERSRAKLSEWIERGSRKGSGGSAITKRVDWNKTHTLASRFAALTMQTKCYTVPVLCNSLSLFVPAAVQCSWGCACRFTRNQMVSGNWQSHHIRCQQIISNSILWATELVAEQRTMAAFIEQLISTIKMTCAAAAFMTWTHH